MKYLRTRLWSIAFDHNFIAAKKNRRTGKTAIQKVDDAIGDFSPPLKSGGAYEDAAFWQHVSLLRAINAGELPEADLQQSPAILTNCCAGYDPPQGPLLMPMTDDLTSSAPGAAESLASGHHPCASTTVASG